MNSLKVAGVVVLYNPTDEDISNIDTYIDEVDVLYVVDNTKGNRNDNRLPKNNKIKYIYNNKNLGIAEALNIAAKEAIKEKYDWILTMDQDTRFDDKVIENVKKEILKINIDNIAIVTPWHNTKLKTKKNKEKIDYPLDVMTSGNFLNLNIYQKLGGFKDWLFIDGVDMEYCLNLNKNGYKIMRLNNYEMKHNLGNIIYRRFLWKDLLITNHSAMRRYYQCRNYHYIRDMYISDYKKYCEILVKLKSIIFCIIFFENNKLEKLKAIYKGYRDYKLGKKGDTYYE